MIDVHRLRSTGDSNPISYPRYSLKRDYLLWVLLVALVVLSALAPREIPAYIELVNWPTIGTLLGLMILTRGVELSGFLHRIGQKLVASISSQRMLALFLVCASGLLAMLLTNDIALFVAVPLTLSLGEFVELPLRRLVIFEALAVNAGSLLSPIGNPQNIFLWQLSAVDFGSFVLHMLPPFIIVAVCLLLLTTLAFPGRAVHVDMRRQTVPVNKPLLLVALHLYIPFLILADLHYTGAALALVAVVFLAGFPRLLRRIDWPLLLIFVLMFIDLGRLAQYPLLGWMNLTHTGVLYLAGALGSQIISNVPAAILLSRHSSDWGTIAWAVDVGGFGLIIGSLANIIALRLGRQPGSLLAFHAWSIPFFLVVGLLTGLWLLR